MTRDIKALISIYLIIVLFCWIIGLKISHNKQVKKLNQDILEVKKIALEVNKSNDEYISMLQSMNEYADSLEIKLQEYKYLEKLKKDLDRNTSK